MRIAKIVAAATLAVAGIAGIVGTTSAQETKAPEMGPIELMFVQQAAGMKYDGKTLTLEGVAPAAIFFADRPQRLTGHLTQKQFVELWNDSQKDSFEKDPPNAAVSIATGEDKPPVIIEIKGASLSGDSLAFDVNVLEGELPAAGGAVAVFVDPWIYRPGWRWGGGWGWGGVAAGAAVGAAVGAAAATAAAPAVNCHYSPYWNQPVCRGVW
jgi:hypothetical protein